VNVLNRVGIARGGCLLLACAATTIAAGCAAGVYAEPAQAYPQGTDEDAIVYVDTAPVNVEVYPHYYYGGGYAYYVEGRWYRRGPRGWGYYRQEPPELEHQRPAMQQAPEVRREHPEVQQAPQAPRERPEERRAPEAPREHTEVRQAPEAPPREHTEVRQAPEAPRQPPGVVENQPNSRSREAPRPARPPSKRSAPPEDRGR
jgi:hypothetical protein